MERPAWDGGLRRAVCLCFSAMVAVILILLIGLQGA